MDNLNSSNNSNSLTGEDLDKIRIKTEDFLNYLDEKYELDDYGLKSPDEVDVELVNEIIAFIEEIEIFNLNLDLFCLTDAEKAVVNSQLIKMSVLSKNDEINYTPEIPEDFDTVEELKKCHHIQPKYWNIIPNKCSACGSDIISNYNLTIVRCSSLRCVHNLASSLRKIAVKESIPGLGGATCFTYFMDNKYKSIFDVLRSPDSKVYLSIQKLKSTKRQYSDWVKFLSLPGIEAQASTLFNGINSYDEYAEQVNRSGSVFAFCLNRLGGEGKQAKNVSQVLIAYDYELQQIDKEFTVSKESEKTVYIALTGNVIINLPNMGRVTKQKYIEFINNIYPEYVKFEKTESVNKASFVVADYTSSSAKYRAGESQNKIISSEQLLLFMLNTEQFMRTLFPESWMVKVDNLKLKERFYGEDSREKSEKENVKEDSKEDTEEND